jgi:hypothetical protein
MHATTVLIFLLIEVLIPIEAANCSWCVMTDNVISNVSTSADSFFYPRGVELEDGTLLVTAVHHGRFPIYKSTDGGDTWTVISNVTDPVTGLGPNAQPFLYELPEDIGGFPRLTVLAAGATFRRGEITIDLYASKDKGYTWTFVSQVAKSNATGEIFEPFLLYYEGQLVCYYSDMRDPLHKQKLTHQTSQNLIDWGPVVEDVAYANASQSPGMTIITQLPHLQKWMLAYEYGGGDSPYQVHYPVYYRFSDSPLTFNSQPGFTIITNGTQPGSSPYVVWTQVGGPNGTIFLSDAMHSQLFANSANGDPNEWKIYNISVPKSYSRYLHIFSKYPTHLMLLCANNWPGTDPPGVMHNFTISVLDVEKLLETSVEVRKAKVFSENSKYDLLHGDNNKPFRTK